jgi:hypothetical protein
MTLFRAYQNDYVTDHRRLLETARWFQLLVGKLKFQEVTG